VERPARQVRPDDQAVSTREVQAHLSRPAADVDDPRIAGNRLIQHPRERVPLGARMQGLQTVARRIAGERRAIVEATHGVRAIVAGTPQVGNAFLRLEAGAAAAADPVGAEYPSTCGAGEQIQQFVHNAPAGISFPRVFDSPVSR
jgi:hypothetical protein